MNWTILILGIIVWILILISAIASFYAGSQLSSITSNTNVNNVVINSNNITNAKNSAWVSGAAAVLAAILLFIMLVFVGFTPDPKVVAIV